MLPKGPYNSGEVEPQILEYWLENKYFKPEYHPQKGLQSMDEMKNDDRDTFCIINPPPNAYMRPHVGNVSGYAYQDVFLRYNRMLGKKVLGQPGKDHAGIQGEVVLEKIFWENKKKSKQDLGREKFYMASYSHFLKLMPKVMDDEKRIGLSSDYDRNLFTLDPRIVKTVLGTFSKMFGDEMIYKGVRIVNWDPVAKTTLADIDTEREEREGELVYIAYPLKTNNSQKSINFESIKIDEYLQTFIPEPNQNIDEGQRTLWGYLQDKNKEQHEAYIFLNEHENIYSLSKKESIKVSTLCCLKIDENFKEYVCIPEHNEVNFNTYLQLYSLIQDRKSDKVHYWFNTIENTLKLFKKYVFVATTRAETMLGDTAVVVNPKDERYKDLIGNKLILPIVNREIPIITSPHVDMEFGTGAVKLTPAHSMDDYKMMMEHNDQISNNKTQTNHKFQIPNSKIGYINIIGKDGRMTGPIPEKYKGMSTEECRKAIIEDLDKAGLVTKREPHSMNVMIGERSKAVVEQIMSSQWFIDVEKLKQPAIKAVKDGDVKVHPTYMKKKYLHWMENLRDWPVSRSLWWGYRIPVWYKGDVKEEINQETGQIVETINETKIEGIYDAVEKGLARVQPYNPAIEENFSPILVPGRGAPENRTLYKDIQKKYPFAQIVETGEISQTYHDFKTALDQIYFDGNSVIVAHSLGASAIIQYILEKDIKIKHLILLAPTNPTSPNYESDLKAGFWADYDQVPSIKEHVQELTVIYSDNDEFYSKEALEKFADYIGAQKIFEPNKMHFLTKKYRHDSIELEKILDKEAQEQGLTIMDTVRHGETDDNKNEIFCGWRDTGLNNTGKQQAQEFAKNLESRDYDLIVSSPLARAKETAEIISQATGLEIQFNENIKERNFGILEGKNWKDIQKDYPELSQKIGKNYQPEIPEGESVDEVYARVDKFIEEVKSKYECKKILVVTHTGILRVLRRKLLEESATATRQGSIGNLEMFSMSVGNKSDWIQDPDVLDTWFSSGQWPYATLEANNLMDTFYPSDIMETAYDILELWVSRMIMLGLYTQGEVPFKDVYLHGLVKAPDGQKMSKSKGNVINPEDIIDEYGADALRLMYIVGNKAGAGYPISYEKLEGYKRFLNKIWNASKFVMMNTQDLEDVEIKSEDLKEHQDEQILKSVQELTKDVTTHIDKYRIGLAADLIYQHFWHTFCDEHLEEVKSRLYTKDKDGNPINQSEEAQQSRKEAQQTLLYVLKAYLKLMHPFIPFITERIWQALPKARVEGETIMYEQWSK